MTKRMRATWRRRALQAGLLLAGVIGLAASASAAVPAFKSGVVVTRSLVLGPNGLPILAEFAADGSVVEIIGETTGELEGAFVISGDAYRQYVAAYEAFMAENGSGVAQGAYLLTREEYEETSFATVSGQAAEKPALFNGTLSVLVRHSSRILAPQISPVLLESAIDLRNRVTLSPQTRAVLLNKEGRVLREAPVNIGYRVAFFTDPSGDYVNDPSDDDRIMRQAGDIAWGPVPFAGIEVTIDPRARAVSGDDGRYSIQYLIPGCPGFQWEYEHDVVAQVYYKNFNPRSLRPWGSYYTALRVYDFCSELSKGFYGGTLIGQMTQVEITAIEATTAIPLVRSDIRIDVSMVTGRGAIAGRTDLVPLGGATIYEAIDPPALPAPIDPAQLRVTRPEADFEHRGLLEEISADDLEDTDIYVFRMSNDQLVTQRKGLRRGEYIHYNDQGTNENEFFYKMLIRGTRMNDYLTGNLQAYQEKTQVNPELVGNKVDFLRAGERIKVVAINRPTGYIGTAIAEVGSGGAGRIDFPIPPIILRPPNLKVKVERVWKVQAGLTQGEQRRNLIGFEGAGLTSDQVVAITTEWFDHDGTTLPRELEGYTGRLAKVVAPSQLGAVGGVGQFDIQPGTHLQLVHLPQADLGLEHYYVHVSGQPQERNPDFSSLGAGGGVLTTRPRHYTPFRVPVFVEGTSAALAALEAQRLASEWMPGEPAPVLSNLERAYVWPYRPEMQFSLYELALTDIDMETEFGADESKMEATVTYDLDEPSQEALGGIGPSGQMIMALGYEEEGATTGSGQTATFEDALAIGQAINNLAPADYLALQLYDSTDLANGLYEYVGLPLVVAAPRNVSLARSHLQGAWNAAQQNSADSDVTDTYQLIDFVVTETSDVLVRLLDSSKSERDELVSKQRLTKGKHVFLITYEDVASAGLYSRDGVDFWVEIEATGADTSSSAPKRKQTVRFAGELRTEYDGMMLGQVMLHDVLIHEGSLHLSRQDLAAAGRGPQLAFSRTYNNRDSRRDSMLGSGWGHNYDITLQVLGYGEVSAADFNLPPWVVDRRGQFFAQGDVPLDDGPPRLIAVSNGGMFKKVGGVWHAQRGQHGDVVELGDTIEYVSKDGTRYSFQTPVRPLPSTSAGSDPVTTALSDYLAVRLGVDPSLYVLDPGSPDLSHMAPAQPSPVQHIEDRNQNRMVLGYESYTDERGVLRPYVSQVTDATGRDLSLTYSTLMGTPGPRLMKVSSSALGITVDFTYDAKGLLASATRSSYVERYRYAPQEGSDLYNLSEVEDAAGNVTRYGYLAVADVPPNMATLVKNLTPGDVIGSVRYADGAEVTFAYDVAAANKRVITDPRGNATTYTLNAYGNPIEIAEPLGRTTTMSWSIDEGQGDNVMLSKTDGMGRAWSYTYDAKGNVTAETDPAGNTTTQSWNQQFSVLVSRTDRNGNTTSFTYDASGNVTGETDGLGNTTMHGYGAGGLRTSTTDRNGNPRTYSHDAYGNLAVMTESADAGLATTTYQYDVRGRLMSVTDPRGGVRSFTYDELDRQTAAIDPLGFRETAGYDSVGNKVREVSKRGLVLAHTYDARGRRTSTVRSADGASMQFGYDANGNLLSETDWKGQTTSYEYDALNRRTAVTNRAGDRTSTSYDLADNQLTVTDAEARVNSYAYDALDRMTSHTDPESGMTSYSYDAEGHVLTVTDPEGRVKTLAYDARYLVVSETDDYGNATLFEYDAGGNLLKQTDREGRVTRYEYGAGNRLKKVIDPLSNETSIGRDLSGNETSLRDAEGRDYSQAFDALDRVARHVDPAGGVLAVEYAPDGAVLAATDPEGRQRTFVYDQLGRMTTRADALGAVTRMEHDANGNVVRVVDPRGMLTTTSYDAMDRPVRMVRGEGSAGAQEITMTYDRAGRVTQSRDARGYSSSFVYDGLDRLTQAVDARGGAWLTSYDRVGNVLSRTDPRGKTTSHTYDRLDRPVRVIDAEAHESSFTYDKVGNQLQHTDPRGIVSLFEYDALDRLLRVTKAGTLLAEKGYDAVGNLITEEDANGNTTTHAYDGLNRRVGTTYADGSTVSFAYDAVGNLTSQTDERGVVVEQRTYDGENRPLTVTNAAGEKITYEYDRGGLVTRVTRPKGDAIRYTYDTLGRLIETRDALSLSRFEYDQGNNLVVQVDPNGNRTEFVYDARGQRTDIVQKNANGDVVTTMEYDLAGLLVAMTDPAGRRFTFGYDGNGRETARTYANVPSAYLAPRKIERSYDPTGNLTSVVETKYDAGAASDVTDVTAIVYDDLGRETTRTSRGKTLVSEYDALGNRTRVAFGGRATLFGYDTRNRLRTVTAEGEGVGTTYHYRTDGMLERAAHPDFETVYAYDGANRVESITHQTPGATPVLLSRVSYAYDTNGNRRQRAEEQSTLGEQVTNYTYDVANRLTGVTMTNGGTTTSIKYLLDAAGNRVSEVVSDGVTSFERVYTYDGSNQLVRMTEGAGAVDFLYDPNGNLLSKLDTRPATPLSTLMDYDVRDQLVRLRRGDAGAETDLGRFDYDYAGRRVRQVGSSRGDLEYFLDRGAVIEERTMADALVAHYRRGHGVARVDSPSSVRYLAADGLGTTLNLIGSGGSVAASYRYDPWGRVLESTGDTAVNRVLFTGKEWDDQTGLHYFGARYYDAELGRFISQDTVIGDPQNPISLNRYAYAFASPAMYVDPDGHLPLLALAVPAIAGAISTGINWGVAKFLEARDYSASEAAMDFVVGAASGGLGMLARAGTVSRGLAVAADATAALGQDSAKARLFKDESYGVSEAAMTLGSFAAFGMLGRAARDEAMSAMTAGRNTKAADAPGLTIEAASSVRSSSAKDINIAQIDDLAAARGAATPSPGTSGSAPFDVVAGAAEWRDLESQLAKHMQAVDGLSGAEFAAVRKDIRKIMVRRRELDAKGVSTELYHAPAMAAEARRRLEAAPSAEIPVDIVTPRPELRPFRFTRKAEEMVYFRGQAESGAEGIALRHNPADLLRVGDKVFHDAQYIPVSIDPKVALQDYGMNRILNGEKVAYVHEIRLNPARRNRVIDWRSTDAYGGKAAEHEFRVLRDIEADEIKRVWEIRKGPNWNEYDPYNRDGWIIRDVTGK